MKHPPIGLTTFAKLVRIKDGDTAVVEVTRTIDVRFLDCWAPEIHGDEKPQGDEAKAYLASLISPGETVVLHVPGSDDGKLADLMTLGRVLGYLWRTGDTLSLSERMVRAGHATTEKAQ